VFIAATLCAAAATETVPMTYAGLSRPYLLHHPPEGRAPMPLVLLLHGGGGAKESTLSMYGWPQKADKEGFLVAAPDAEPVFPERPAAFTSNPRAWNDGSGRFPQAKRNVDDVGYLVAVVQDAIKRAGADPSRVYVTGFSNGASMTYHLGYLRPDLFAAIAPCSGHLWDKGDKLARPLPLISFAGSVDPLNPLNGGPSKTPWKTEENKEPMIASLERWAELDGCPEPARSQPAEKVTLTTWSPCSAGTEVRFYVVDGLGHQWPGAKLLTLPGIAGPTSDAIDATAVIWDFFRRFKR
jgi:polyhydroxybutyrate depolymerase